MSVSRRQDAGSDGVDAVNKLNSMFEPAGYPILSTGEIDRASSVLSWNNTNRELTISPTGDSFVFYSENKEYTKTTPQTKQITDSEGLWFFYFDENGELQATQSFDLNFIYNQAFTALLYWDADNKVLIGDIFDERHGVKLDGHQHGWDHEKFGTRHESGGLLNTINSSGSGDDDSHAQFGVDSAVIYDEDLLFNIDAVLSTTGIPVLYLEGAEPKLRVINNPGFPVATTGSGRLAYNEDVGGVWQISEVNNNDFVFYHIFITSGPDTTGKVYAIMGQNDYLTRTEARREAQNEIRNLLNILPVQEKDWIATVIYQTSDGYANAVKGRVIDTGTTTNPDYLDWRFHDYKDFVRAENA